MRRPLVAASRFYEAFWRWTCWNSPSPSPRAFHAAHRVLMQDGGAKTVFEERYSSPTGHSYRAAAKTLASEQRPKSRDEAIVTSKAPETEAVKGAGRGTSKKQADTAPQRGPSTPSDTCYVILHLPAEETPGSIFGPYGSIILDIQAASETTISSPFKSIPRLLKVHGSAAAVKDAWRRIDLRIQEVVNTGGNTQDASALFVAWGTGRSTSPIDEKDLPILLKEFYSGPAPVVNTVIIGDEETQHWLYLLIRTGTGLETVYSKDGAWLESIRQRSGATILEDNDTGVSGLLRVIGTNHAVSSARDLLETGLRHAFDYGKQAQDRLHDGVRDDDSDINDDSIDPHGVESRVLCIKQGTGHIPPLTEQDVENLDKEVQEDSLESDPEMSGVESDVWLQLYVPNPIAVKYVLGPALDKMNEIVDASNASITPPDDTGVPGVFTLSGTMPSIRSAWQAINVIVEEVVRGGMANGPEKALGVDTGAGSPPNLSSQDQRRRLEQLIQDVLLTSRTEVDANVSQPTDVNAAIPQTSQESEAPNPVHWEHLFIVREADSVGLSRKWQQRLQSKAGRDIRAGSELKARPTISSIAELRRPESTRIPGLFTLVGSKTQIDAARSRMWEMLSEDRGDGRKGKSETAAGTRQEDETKGVAGMGGVRAIVLDRGTGTPAAVATEKSDWATKRHQPMFTRGEISEALRVLLTRVSQPVVLVTARHPASVAKEDRSSVSAFRGVTVSSFNTVTLSPQPVISFNLRTPSRTLDAIQLSKEVNVHILQGNTPGATIAHTFTQRYEEPHEPFEILRRFRGSSFTSSHPLEAPRVELENGTFAIIRARHLASHDVTIGDHVVCFFSVESISLGNETEPAPRNSPDVANGDPRLLTYVKRAYHGRKGLRIDPYDLEWSWQEGRVSQKDVSAARTAQARPKADYADPRRSIFTQENGRAAETADESTKPAVNVDATEEARSGVSPFNQKRASTARISSERKRTLERGPIGSQANRPETSQNQSPPPTPVSVSHTRPWGVAQHVGPRAWGLPSNIRQFSAIFGPILRRSLPYPSADASDMTDAFEIGPDTSSAGITSPEMEANDKRPQVDPAVPQMTVDEFLCHSFRRPAPRFKSLVSLREEAQKASDRLREAMADGTLSALESQQLEYVVMRNERRIARVLGLRAAADLREILDHGLVASDRVQYLESCIEKGQATVLQEAKRLLAMWDERRIPENIFVREKEALEREDVVLKTEAMRLKDHLEEEDDD